MVLFHYFDLYTVSREGLKFSAEQTKLEASYMCKVVALKNLYPFTCRSNMAMIQQNGHTIIQYFWVISVLNIILQ